MECCGASGPVLEIAMALAAGMVGAAARAPGGSRGRRPMLGAQPGLSPALHSEEERSVQLMLSVFSPKLLDVQLLPVGQRWAAPQQL